MAAISDPSKGSKHPNLNKKEAGYRRAVMNVTLHARIQKVHKVQKSSESIPIIGFIMDI